MKKNFLTFFFALITSSIFALPENERCITFTENSPFKVTAKGDGILVGACVATTATALALPYILDLPDYDERTYTLRRLELEKVSNPLLCLMLRQSLRESR
mgnify:CR=1 FL=1